MTIITLTPFTHNAQRCIAIKFKFDFNVKEYIRKGNGVKYTITHNCFYIYFNDIRLQKLKQHIIDGGYHIIDVSPKILDNIRLSRSPNHTTLDHEKIAVHTHFINFLKGKRFSPSTVTTYGNFILAFLRYTGNKPVSALNANDVRLYIEWSVGTLNYAVSTHRQMVSGLKHFAHFYPVCGIDPEAIYMPKKDKKLPVILSIEEVLSLIQVTKNLKHRTIIAMLYASGLRIGELISLELKDFDFNRNVLHIRNSKGRKDRYATIAKSLHPLLKNYHATYKPKRFFIENPKGGMYSPTSIRSFLKKSCKNARILKDITPHSLRHTYATHLLEQGTDIRYIQELLGHSRPETTMIYTQVTQKDLKEIKSPLDTSLNNISLRDNNNKNPLIT